MATSTVRTCRWPCCRAACRVMLAPSCISGAEIVVSSASHMHSCMHRCHTDAPARHVGATTTHSDKVSSLQHWQQCCIAPRELHLRRGSLSADTCAAAKNSQNRCGPWRPLMLLLVVCAEFHRGAQEAHGQHAPARPTRGPLVSRSYFGA